MTTTDLDSTDLDPSLSHTRGETDVPLLTETIPANLAGTVERFGDRDALVDVPAGRRWTYTEFLADVRRLASGLHRLGIRTGDRVGIWSPNRWEWVMIQYATAELGAVLVNINPSYRVHELEYVLKQASIRAVVAAPQFKDSDYTGMLAQVQPSCPDLEVVVLFGDEEWESMMSGPTHSEELAQIRSGLDAGDPINIQYTSGTTGFPKGATLSHVNILNNGFHVGEICRYTEADRICIPVPFYHCFGMVMGNLAATSHGACMVIPAPGFDPALTLAAVRDERCTSLYGVPTMFVAEWALIEAGAASESDLATVRTGIMAGAPCPAELMKKVIAAGINEMTICYGMTETSPVSTQTRTDDSFDRKVGTVGRCMPHLQIGIIDPSDGSFVERGVSGEFVTQGYSVMLGYWNQPDKTAESVVDGWMHTGDLAVMDEDGYVQITGRIKDMVIRGGENIYPREIEEFLYTHPDILDAQVIGVPDPKYGEELCAWVRMKPGATPVSAASIREFATGKLAHYKIPRYVKVVEDFPMTVTGKIRKIEMRERSAQELGLS